MKESAPMESRRLLPGGMLRRDGAAERDWARLDLPNVLWFFGAVTTAISTLVIIGKVPESQRDIWVLLASLGFLVAYALAGALLLRRDWRVPGGLMAAVAVVMVPAVGYAVTKLAGVYPDDSSLDPFSNFDGGVFTIALATMAAALVAYALTGFTFLFALVMAAALFTAQLLTPAFGTTGGDRALTAIVTGAIAVGVGLLLDGRGLRRHAFWFYVGGYFALAGAFVYYVFDGLTSGSTTAWISLLIVGLLVLVGSGVIRRASWAAYGALGVYAALFHYLDRDDWVSFLLLAVSLGVFLLGIVVSSGRRSPPAAADTPAAPEASSAS